MSEDILFQIADRLGITRGYLGLDGQERPTSADIAHAFVRGMGHQVSEEALKTLEQESWAAGVHGVVVARPGEAVRVRWTVPHHRVRDVHRWTLTNDETGECASQGECVPDTCPIEEQGEFDDRRTLVLGALEPGYYRLQVEDSHCHVVCAPIEAHRPKELDARRMWGPAIQLYALRTENNWGIGDFDDLESVVHYFASLGADFVGLNPLHSLFPDNPSQASPYGPSSRSWLNPIYIAVEEVPEVKSSSVVQSKIQDQGFRERLQHLRDTEFVDYTGVNAIKIEILRLAYDEWSKSGERFRAFEAFCDRPGLMQHATWEVLQVHFARQGRHGFFNWPEEYRSPGNEAVSCFVDEHSEDVRFRAYLQWIASVQLGSASKACSSHGMAIGLYSDLAVGVAGDSAERWVRPSLYGEGANVGAPPDDFNLQGQDWGMPPPIPAAMERDGLRAFREVLASTMSTSGAVRIDHVMALRRLYWVPHGESAAHGAYVLYPFDAMMAVTTLESARRQCLVVGEDLGVVPPEVTRALRAARAYSYRILFFEQHGPGRFKGPDDFLSESITVASTHDLPTLKGFWEGRDLEIRDELELWPETKIREEFFQARTEQRQGLLDALCAEGVWNGEKSAEKLGTLPQELADAMLVYIARGKNELMAVQLEDVMGQREQVNLPGTVSEHPNWNRKLPKSFESLRDDESRRAIFNRITEERRKGR